MAMDTMKRKRNTLQRTLRVRKRVRVWRFIAINLSRRSVSVSIGAHGITLNLNRRAAVVTLSIYGTGFSYRIGAPWVMLWHWTKTILARFKQDALSNQGIEQGDEPWTGMK